MRYIMYKRGGIIMNTDNRLKSIPTYTIAWLWFVRGVSIVDWISQQSISVSERQICPPDGCN